MPQPSLSVIAILRELHVTDTAVDAVVQTKDEDGSQARYRLYPSSPAVERQFRYSGLKPGDRVEVEIRWQGQPSPALHLSPAPLDLQVPAWEHGPEADQRAFLFPEWTTRRWDEAREGDWPADWQHRVGLSQLTQQTRRQGMVRGRRLTPPSVPGGSPTAR